MPKQLVNKEGRGVLFTQTGRKHENAPLYKGGINLDGIEYELSAWEKMSKNGNSYLSLTIRRAGEWRNGDSDVPY